MLRSLVGSEMCIRDSYIHRVGRTARAGSHGKAINLISQYDIVQLQTIEKAIGIEMKEWPVVDGEIEQMLQRVEDAEQEALREMREQDQADKLTKEEGTLTSAKVARRMRGDRMDLSDNRGDSHGLARARKENEEVFGICLLYTSDAADEEDSVDLGGRRIIKKKKNQSRSITRKCKTIIMTILEV
eukprot:TRINITY_DN10978_c0_g1_i1.p1 TRINITY_DN10978_c0_g1~~TRINITY_DN10978_c0_g1_i1.p1  ORF type:complete len:186 (+),score=76.17 TRINITY_DN10978_c0_g1_i1:127-684(+)